MTYDEQRGYFFSYAADERVEGRVTGVEGMGESGAAVSAGAQVREFNVSVLVEVGMFCGLGVCVRESVCVHEDLRSHARVHVCVHIHEHVYMHACLLACRHACRQRYCSCVYGCV